MGSGKAAPPASEASSSCTWLLSSPFSSVAVRHGHWLLTLTERSRFSRPSAGRCVQSTIIFPVGLQEALLAASRGGNSPRDLGMSHAMTAFSNNNKKSFMAPWNMGDAAVGRDNAGWDYMEKWMSLPIPELLTMASLRKDCKRSFPESFLMRPQRPSTLNDFVDLNW